MYTRSKGAKEKYKACVHCKASWSKSEIGFYKYREYVHESFFCLVTSSLVLFFSTRSSYIFIHLCFCYKRIRVQMDGGHSHLSMNGIQEL